MCFFVRFQQLISPGSLVKTFLGGENWVRRCHLLCPPQHCEPQHPTELLWETPWRFLQCKKGIAENHESKNPLWAPTWSYYNQTRALIQNPEPWAVEGSEGSLSSTTHLTFSYILSSWAVAGHHWRQDFWTKRGFCMQTLSLSTSDILPQYKLPEGSGSKPQTQPLGFSRPPLPIPDLLLLS